MDGHLRILILEDSPYDASFIEKTLERAGFELTTKIVSTRNDFIAALSTFSPDVVLSDHQLPQFSSPEALKISKEKCPFVPFLLVTGAVSEEFAASIILEGADDYLLKANLKRLPTAIKLATERKRTAESLERSENQKRIAEQNLRDAHERLLFHIENTPLGYIEWDDQLNVKSWSKRAEEIFGWTEREFMNHQKNGFSTIYEEDLEWASKISAQLANGEIERNNIQTRNYTKDGRVVWCDWFNSVMKNADGKVVTIMSLVQDITEQKKFIEEIEKLSLVASKTNNSVIITNENDHIEWVNQGFVSLTGYSLAEVKGLKPGHVLQGPETDPATIKRIGEKLRDHESFTEEIINYSKNGRKYWVRLDISPVFNDKRILKHFIAIQTDITTQKEFQNQITNIARELSSLIENANVPIFGVDRNGYINEWNRISFELTEYSKNDVLEKKLTDKLKSAISQEFLEILKNVFEGESIQNYELPFESRTGKQLVLLISVSPRMDVNKNIYGAICVGQDITELFHYRKDLEEMVKERTRDLNEALQKEKQLVEMKSKFVSIASHEFRTPLSNISLAAGFLDKHHKKITPEEFGSKLQGIEKQVSHMTYLLDDILMIGKGEAGKILANYSSISIKDFFTQTVREVEQSAGSYRIRLNLNCSVTQFNVDEKLLRNIVINLLTNAIKFSRQIKDVVLTVSNTSRFLHFEVADRGLGIPEEDMEKLFTAFHRGTNVGAIQGTGLGLSIVKKAVELLHGEIKVKSKIGKGTVFHVALPLDV